VLYLLCTEVIEYAAEHLLHISRDHARQVLKNLIFNFHCSVLMNTFCHTVCCIYAVEQTLLWDSRHSHDINNMMHAQGRTQGGWVGLKPPWVWYVTITLLPVQRRLLLSSHTFCFLICWLNAKIAVVNWSDVVMSAFYFSASTLILIFLQLWTAVS